MTLPVNAIRGPEWIGEGPHLGRRCHTIVFGSCNLHCPGCDVPATWDTTRYDLDRTCPPATPEEIVSRLDGTATLVQLTGGEPLLHQRRRDFVDLLDRLGHIPVHVETNGTIPPYGGIIDRVTHFSVSVKLRALGGADTLRRRVRPVPIAVFNTLAMEGRAHFKMVCATAADVEEVSEYCRAYGVLPQWVWIMPFAYGAGTSAEPLDELAFVHARISPAVARYGFNLTTRLQTITDFRSVRPRIPAQQVTR